MKKLLTGIIILAGLLMAGIALAVPFSSYQLAPNPVNLNCLTTNGTANVWSASCGSGGGGGAGGGWSTSTPNIISTNWLSSTNALVGINSSTPNGVLVVQGISATTTPTLVVASSTGASLFQVNSNGNVGIRLTNPNFTLEVAGTASTTNLNVATNTTLKNVVNTFLATDPTGLIVSTTSPLSVALAATTYPTFTYATNTYATILNYPTYTYATNTYATILNYPTYTYATNTFATIANYPTYTYATNTFATILNYPSFTYGSSTYVNYNYGTSTYQTLANSPTYTYASSSYATMWNTVAGANITIDTSTAGTLKITGAAGGGGGGGGLGTTSPFTAGTVPIATGTNITLSDSVITQAVGGNIGVGSSTPIATLSVKGSGSTNPFIISSSTDAYLLAVTPAGRMEIGTTTAVSAISLAQGTTAANGINFGDTKANLYRVSASTIKTDGNLTVGSNNIDVSAGGSLVLNSNVTSQVAVGVKITNDGATQALTSTGTNNQLMVTSLVNFTGSATMNYVSIEPTFTQGIAATGIYRGLYLNPTITSTYDYRNIETATLTNTVSNNKPVTTLYNVLFNPITYQTNSTTLYTIANASTLNIAGAPIASTTSLAISSSTALSIQSNAVTASTTNSYGIWLNAATGAANNYAAVFLGGNVGVGTTSPSYMFVVGGTIQQASSTNCSNGIVTDVNGVFNGCVASDIRLKKDIKDMPLNPSLFDKIKGKLWFWKDPKRGTEQAGGFGAQFIKPYFPECVNGGGKNLLGVDANCMTANLWNYTMAFNKEFLDFVHTTVARLDGQDKKIQAQQRQIDTLQRQVNLLLKESAKGK